MVAQWVKKLPAMQEHARDMGLTPGLEDPLEEGMETYSGILPWRIPRTEEPGWLQLMGLQRVEHD